MNYVRICFVRISTLKEKKRVFKKDYSKELEQIAQYLILLRKFNINQKKFRKFKNYILHFLIREKRLFQQTNKNMLLKRVIDLIKNKDYIVKSLYNKRNYKDRKNL